ncbi:MAG: rod shape-determining protein MreC [Acidobacteria bacterium]|nr:rod shape-determining protein MreC [Acidobacteriota bacterium]
MIHRQTLSLLIVICLGHVLLISAQVQSKSGVPVLESVVFAAYARVQQAMTAAVDGVRGTWTNYLAVHGAARERDELRRRLLELQGELQQRQALAARAQALEALLGLKQSVIVPTLAARVIGANPSPGTFTVTIDRGAGDGLRPDLPVIATRGVVGRVIAPISAGAATVQLLTDRLAAVAVTFERSGSGAIVVGGAGDLFRAEYVPAAADVQAGERVVTSGQDGVFPQGFLVGTVERVTRPSGGEREVLITPAVDFSHLDLVLVVPISRPATESPE